MNRVSCYHFQDSVIPEDRKQWSDSLFSDKSSHSSFRFRIAFLRVLTLKNKSSTYGQSRSYRRDEADVGMLDFDPQEMLTMIVVPFTPAQGVGPPAARFPSE